MTLDSDSLFKNIRKELRLLTGIIPTVSRHKYSSHKRRRGKFNDLIDSARGTFRRSREHRSEDVDETAGVLEPRTEVRQGFTLA